MTDQVPENTKRRSPHTYSPELIQRIRDKLAEDMSLREIAHSFDWSPDYSTLRRWQRDEPYARKQFHLGRTADLEATRKDRLTELKHTNFDDMAVQCSELDVSPGMKEKLFQVKSSHIYKEIEQIYKELSVEDPNKYGNKVSIKTDLSEKAALMSADELKKWLIEHKATLLLESHPADYVPEGRVVEGAVIEVKGNEL